MITGKRVAILMAYSAAILTGASLSLMGCGPKYPNCLNDDNCRQQGEVCVNGVCKACRDDSQCNSGDPCRLCTDYSCSRKSGCCTTDADCPGGRCWNVPGKNYGECGAQCDAEHPCPPGQRCNNGMCEPDAECGPSAPCPPGKICQNGRCVAQCELETVYFDFNESRIRLDQQTKLNNNADCIKNRNTKIRIEGNCDERGTDEYNMALGESRASSSKRYLSNLGIAGAAMRTISYGEERPVCTQSNESCWSQNRRAEFHWE